MIWRVSLFIYSNYKAPPYFTYWRITQFFEDEPSIEDVEEMEGELRAFAESESAKKGQTLSKKVREEIEQVDEEERNGMPFGESRISRSHGREPEIPSEDYVGSRQSGLDEFSGDDVEDES